MTSNVVEIGTVSARGQVAIPAEVRRRLALAEGERIIFALQGDTLLIKKFDKVKTWEEITKPLREKTAKANLKESDVSEIIHNFRKTKKR